MNQELLTDTFVDLADTLVADFDVIDFLHLLSDRAVELLGASAAGVMLADPRGQLRLVAASSQAPSTPPTCASARPWPTPQPSACSTNATCGVPKSSVSSCKRPSTAGSSSSRPRENSLNASAWTWTRPSPRCDATPATTTCAYPTSPRHSSRVTQQSSPASPNQHTTGTASRPADSASGRR